MAETLFSLLYYIYYIVRPSTWRAWAEWRFTGGTAFGQKRKKKDEDEAGGGGVPSASAGPGCSLFSSRMESAREEVLKEGRERGREGGGR